MTVADLLARVSSRELAEWIKFYELEDEHRQREGGSGMGQGGKRVNTRGL